MLCKREHQRNNHCILENRLPHPLTFGFKCAPLETLLIFILFWIPHLKILFVAPPLFCYGIGAFSNHVISSIKIVKLLLNFPRSV